MSTPQPGPSDVKAMARADARARRREAARPDPRALADQVLDFLLSIPGPARVTCYASYGTEPPTDVLLAQLSQSGFDVLLPRVDGDRLEWVLYGPVTTVSSMGIAEPTGPAVDLLPVRALLIPALAVTPRGDRLGKGGGYYDRTLAELGGSPPVVVALVGDVDVVDEVPTQPHDHRVDVVITPTRVIDCRRSRP